MITTNMPAIAEALQGTAEHRVFLTGGEYIHSNGVLGGPQMLSSIADCVFDLAIIGAYGIDLRFGLVESGRENQHLKQSLLARSRDWIFLANSTKFGASGTYCSVPLSRAGTVVTDTMPSPEFTSTFEELGVRLLWPAKPTSMTAEAAQAEEKAE